MTREEKAVFDFHASVEATSTELKHKLTEQHCARIQMDLAEIVMNARYLRYLQARDTWLKRTKEFGKL